MVSQGRPGLRDGFVPWGLRSRGSTVAERVATVGHRLRLNGSAGQRGHNDPGEAAGPFLPGAGEDDPVPVGRHRASGLVVVGSGLPGALEVPGPVVADLDVANQRLRAA